MAIAIYLEGTEGQTDGTIEVTGDGVGIELSEVGSAAVFHFRAPAGKQTAEAVTVNAPLDCEVSKDGNTFGTTAIYAAGSIQDANVACYVRRKAVTQVAATVYEQLSTTPHCAQVAISNKVTGDTTAPTLTGSLSATAGAAQVVLDWSDATDNVGVTGYDIEHGTSTSYGTVTTSPNSAKTITGLTNGTLYYFRVRAYDAAGNKSSWLTATATPAVAADSTAPTLTGSLSATAGAAQVVLDWSDATDNVGVTGYDIEHGTTTSYGTATTSSVSNKTITGLAVGTLYYFRVRAYDSAGNKSSWITASATTAVLAGEGTIGSPYQVTSVADWNYVADNNATLKDSYFVLANSINGGGATLRGWPILTTRLDGAGFTISNAVIAPTSGNAYLIGTVKEVKNLTLSAVTITAPAATAGSAAAPFISRAGVNVENLIEGVKIVNCNISSLNATGLAYGLHKGPVDTNINRCSVIGGSITAPSGAYGLCGFLGGGATVTTTYTNNAVNTTLSSSTECFGFCGGWATANTVVTNNYTAVTSNGTAATKRPFSPGVPYGSVSKNFTDTTLGGVWAIAGISDKTTTEMKSGSTAAGGIANTSTGLPSGVGSGVWTFPASAYPVVA